MTNAWFERRHKRLSVRPRLVAWRVFRGPTEIYGVKLVNNGIGPAELTSIELALDGLKIDSNHDGWSKAIDAVGLNSKNWFLMRPSPGATIRAGEELWLLRSPSLEAPANEVIRALNRITMKVGYKSMYEEMQPELEREWAGLDQVIKSEDDANQD